MDDSRHTAYLEPCETASIAGAHGPEIEGEVEKMTDEEAIRETIQIYFDAMFESDASKVFDAFHENAKITGYIAERLTEMSVSDFATFVSAQSSAKAAGETPFLEEVSLTVAGNTAVALVRDDYIGNRFLDTLSFVKSDRGWVIYNKLFHIEGSAA